MNIAETRHTLTAELENAKLIAVSKKQPEDRINAALAAGQRIFGENRVQEAQTRWSARRASYPDLELHLIGPLQTNKAKEAVTLFNWIHTLDRSKLARVLSKEMKRQEKSLPILIQVNTGEEEQKSGVLPTDLPALLEESRQFGLDVRGLMCIPPIDEPSALHFAFLKKLAGECGLKELSMGMSSDYHKALALGATMIRVGSVFFGPRPD